MGKDLEREQRLAEALRANLRRRKQQQRGQDGPAADTAEHDPSEDRPAS